MYAVGFYVLLWTYYSFSDEIMKKVGFVTEYRTQKDLLQLKSIFNLLVPSVIRSSDHDAKKFAPVYESDVTVVFIDLEDFDQMVHQFPGKKLLEILDKIYNGFDELCEQYGLQKLETMGRNYVACAGLKSNESEFNNRAMGNHHTVRVTDFALHLQRFITTQTIMSKKIARVKICIATGDAISGIIGEIK